MFRCLARAGLPRSLNACGFASSSFVSGTHTNSPMDLDPSLRELLKDVDMSLRKARNQVPTPHKELEVFEVNEAGIALQESSPEEEEDEGLSGRLQRKSPAALFGSKAIGAVVIPDELQLSINQLIAEADRPQLHSDAKRLFQQPDARDEDGEWKPEYNVKYKSRPQKERHAERDGTAFASVALPAQFAAITAVLGHLKHRLEPSWKPDQVFDWGAGTGSAMWAALYAFQDKRIPYEDRRVSDSSIVRYVSMDKREGLTAMGRRLVSDTPLGSISLNWQKSFQPDDKMKREDARNTIAISAFNLSALPTTINRKAMIKEMWESGANIIVVIDHNTTSGFEAIAEARQYLLGMGRKEVEDPAAESWAHRGAHVIAPCPHDGRCPLHHPGSIRLVCGFEQRLQRPAFVRLTKHSGVGHEDMGYSYIAIRRGPRPVAGDKKVGRIGEIAREHLEKQAEENIPMKELLLHDDPASLLSPVAEPDKPFLDALKDEPQTAAEMEEALRLEAYDWPRLIFSPLKNAGHIILDVCHKEGEVLRMTVPKSQGKQPYYDARKSSWGDIFPHPPKNPPQIRHQPKRAKRKGGTTAAHGEDIGKRQHKNNSSAKFSYETVAKGLKTDKIQKRQREKRSEKIQRKFEAANDYNKFNDDD